MFKFFSRSKGWPGKERTPFLSSRVENSPTVVYDYGTGQPIAQNAQRDGLPLEEDDNLQYEDEEEEGAGDEDEDEDDIDIDNPLLPIFSSAFLGKTFFLFHVAS